MSAPRLPQRTLQVKVYDSTNTTLRSAWPDAATAEGALRFRLGTGTSERLELVLPRRVGLAGAQYEIGTDNSLAIDNYLRIYLSDYRTLSAQQGDAAAARTGSTETDLSRLMWQGEIRAIGRRPGLITVSAVGELGAAAASPQAHRIGAGMLLDYNLEVSDYRSHGNVDYTGWVLIPHDSPAIDTAAVKLGDTMVVHEERVLSADTGDRYLAYSDTARTIYSLEWQPHALLVQFDARQPSIVDDQLSKLTNITRDSATGTVTSTDILKSSGLITTADPSGVANAVTISNVTTTATPRSTGVGTVLFTDGVNRDCVGLWKVRDGTTSYYVPLFAAG